MNEVRIFGRTRWRRWWRGRFWFRRGGDNR